MSFIIQCQYPEGWSNLNAPKPEYDDLAEAETEAKAWAEKDGQPHRVLQTSFVSSFAEHSYPAHYVDSPPAAETHPHSSFAQLSD